MAAILKLRRGTSIPSLAESELFFNQTNKTLVIGDVSTTHTLVKIGSNTGSINLSGDITASNLLLTGDITARDFTGRDVRLSGNIFLGDEIADNISITAQFSGSLIPSASAEYDLGSDVKKWNKLYVVSASIDNISLPSSNIVSSSQQISNYDVFLEKNGDNVFSSSVQVNANSITNFDSNVKSKMNTDEVISGSSQVQLNNVNGFTSYSQSVDGRIGSLELFTSSQENLNQTFATTGSNIFIGNQIITGSLDIVDGEFSILTGSGQLTSSLTFTHNITSPGDGNATLELRHNNDLYGDDIALQIKTDFAGAYFNFDQNGIPYSVLSVNSFVNRNIYLHQDTRLLFSSLRIDENLIVTGSLLSSASAYFLGDVTASIFTGSFIGDGSGLENVTAGDVEFENILNKPTLVSQSQQIQIDATTGFPAYSSSINSRLSTLEEDFSSSVESQLNSINNYTSSLKQAIDTNGSDLIVLGNLTVQGQTTTLNTSELLIEDILIALASGSQSSGESDGAGIFISGANASMFWNHSNQLLEFNTKVSSSVGFKGDGSELTGILHENVDFGGSNIISSSTQIPNILPSGVVSGSDQITSSLDSRYLQINGENVVSGSDQVSSSLDLRYLQINGDGVVSGSVQIILSQTTNYVSGIKDRLNAENIFSSSMQLTASLDSRYLNANGEGVVSSSLVSSNEQGLFTSSVNGIDTFIDLGLQESDSPTFEGISLTNLTTLGSGEVTALFSGSAGQVGIRTLGTAAFFNVSASVGDDPNSIPTNKAVSDALIAAGAGDITAVNDSTLYTSDYLGLEHTGDGTLNGGYGQLGNVVIAIATGSAKFTQGVVKALPSGTISSSAQVNITQSQISDLVHYTDSDTLNYINGRGVISSSVQVNADSITNFDTNVKDKMNTDGVISGSAQIIGGSGIVSSSQQISNYNTFLEINGDGVVSGSLQIDLTQTTNFADGIKLRLNTEQVISGSGQILAGSGIVSSSQQISNYNVFAELNGDGLVSSSVQVKSLLPIGTVSGSAQVDADNITNFDDNVKDKMNTDGVISGSGQILAGSGIVSSSQQISNYNTFLEINGDGVVSSSQQISDYDVFLEINGMGVISGSQQFTGSFVTLDTEQTISGTKTFNDIVVNGTGSFSYIVSTTGSAKIIGDAYIILNNDTPTERYAGLKVYDSGSVNTTASLQFDGQTNDWFYQYSDDGGATTDHGVVLFGPEYSGIGNPTYPTANRIQKGNGGHHLLDSNITDSGTLITLGSAVDVSGITNFNDTTQSTSKTTGAVVIDGGVGIAKTLNVGEDVVAYASSDRRLKDNITPIENSLQKINSIGGYSFVWNQNQHIYSGKDYGVIAQEIEEILPELVETREDGYKAVKYDRIVSLLIEGIKELSKEVSELKNKIGE